MTPSNTDTQRAILLKKSHGASERLTFRHQSAHQSPLGIKGNQLLKREKRKIAIRIKKRRQRDREKRETEKQRGRERRRERSRDQKLHSLKTEPKTLNHPFFPFVNTNGQKKRFSLPMKKKKQKPIERLLHGERRKSDREKREAEKQRGRDREKGATRSSAIIVRAPSISPIRILSIRFLSIFLTSMLAIQKQRRRKK